MDRKQCVVLSWKSLSQSPNARTLKGGVIDKYGDALVAAETNQANDEFRRRISAGQIEKFGVAYCPVLMDRMQTELEGNLLIWPCVCPDRLGKPNCFEIQELQRQWVRCESGGSGLGVKENGTVDRMRLNPQLLRVEQFAWNIAQIVDSFFR